MTHDEVLREAYESLRYAEHLVHLVEDVVGDPKILLAALNHLFTAYAYGMQAILRQAHARGDLRSIPSRFEDAFRLFRRYCMPLGGDAEEHCTVIRELRDVVMAHQESAVEFTRQGSYVMCTDDYEMTLLTPQRIRYFTEKGKLFIQQINRQLDNE